MEAGARRPLSRQQARRLRAYARAVGEGAGCDEAGREQADAFLAGNRPGPHGRVQRHTDLAGFYRYAMARGLATSAPLPAQAPRKPPSAPPHVYSRDELRRLLDATRTYAQRICQLEPHTMRALLLVLYGAGLRPGEALRIVLDDLDLRTALLTVRDTKFHKTRLVPLGPQLARVLREYAERRRAAGAPPAGEAAFLVNRDGGTASRRNRQPGVPKIAPGGGCGERGGGAASATIARSAPRVRGASPDRLVPPRRRRAADAAAAVHVPGPLQRRCHPDLPHPDSGIERRGNAALRAVRGRPARRLRCLTRTLSAPGCAASSRSI